MNTRFKSLMLATIVAVLGVGISQAAKQPFSITIHAADRIVMGSELRLQITLRNVSGRDIVLPKVAGDSQADLDYVIEVRDMVGQSPPDTERGQMIKGKSTSRLFKTIGFVGVKRGEKLQDQVVVDRVYDLSHPGQYTIQVTRDIPDDLGGGVAKSNTITVTVAP